MNDNNNPNFRLKPVAEFLDGNHSFYIPSYQRGYRWDEKQVEDLCKDIWDFAKNAKKGDFYCLQPIVVKEKQWNNGKTINGWEVIDGQQRLTTILLYLSYLRANSEDAKESEATFYEIYYKTRPNLDFDNLDYKQDIDSFYASKAKEVIKKWFEGNKVRKSKIVEVLFDLYNEKDNEPQVKFIWYVVTNDSDIESIKTFNNLNKGKIRLTNSELIKALFILKSQEEKDGCKTEQLNLNELAYEWNEIENALHNDSFWFFLTNKDYNPATRIDIIFDFLTEKPVKVDTDYSYRKFQELFDNINSGFLEGKDITNFTQAWEEVKKVYQTFVYWFENGTLFHYIGFLIEYGVSIKQIFKECSSKNKSEMPVILQGLIKNIFDSIDINELSYKVPKEKHQLKTTLLLFNIETCVLQQNDENSYYKFPFDLYKNYKWDIEHIDSQTENPLKDPRDKIIWLSYIENLDCPEELKLSALNLKSELEEKRVDVGNKFEDIYRNILSSIRNKNSKTSESDSDDSLENLTLLDAGTNRGYGNALFPTKRQTIIEKEHKGTFIPPCTKNLFLKYYTKDDKEVSQWKNTWTQEDKGAYRKAIFSTIGYLANDKKNGNK
jgi:uncharacterized protein with ParB-like and HNH nuclease domain